MKLPQPSARLVINSMVALYCAVAILASISVGFALSCAAIGILRALSKIPYLNGNPKINNISE